jgi:hypothetical protein
MTCTSEVAVADVHTCLVSAEAIILPVIAMGESRVFTDGAVNNPSVMTDRQRLGDACDVAPEPLPSRSRDEEVLPSPSYSSHSRDS